MSEVGFVDWIVEIYWFLCLVKFSDLVIFEFFFVVLLCGCLVWLDYEWSLDYGGYEGVDDVDEVGYICDG